MLISGKSMFCNLHVSEVMMESYQFTTITLRCLISAILIKDFINPRLSTNVEKEVVPEKMDIVRNSSWHV